MSDIKENLRPGVVYAMQNKFTFHYRVCEFIRMTGPKTGYFKSRDLDSETKESTTDFPSVLLSSWVFYELKKPSFSFPIDVAPLPDPPVSDNHSMRNFPVFLKCFHSHGKGDPCDVGRIVRGICQDCGSKDVSYCCGLLDKEESEIVYLPFLCMHCGNQSRERFVFSGYGPNHKR